MTVSHFHMPEERRDRAAPWWDLRNRTLPHDRTTSSAATVRAGVRSLVIYAARRVEVIVVVKPLFDVIELLRQDRAVDAVLRLIEVRLLQAMGGRRAGRFE